MGAQPLLGAGADVQIRADTVGGRRNPWRFYPHPRPLGPQSDPEVRPQQVGVHLHPIRVL